jgi:hypothetical protein
MGHVEGMSRLSNLALAAILLLPASTAGQALAFGLNTGLTRSSQSRAELFNRRFTTQRWAPTFGAYGALSVSPKLSVRLESSYVAKGFWGVSYAVNLAYLDFPLIAQVKPWGGRRVNPIGIGGLSANRLLHCNIEDGNPETDRIVYPRGYECAGRKPTKWDASVVIGTGVEIVSRNADVTLQLRYSHGFTPAYVRDAKPRSYNRVLYVMGGLSRFF